MVTQKKRIERLQADLEKSQDAIQLVQIDLACQVGANSHNFPADYSVESPPFSLLQRTDNNNLTAENIALK